MDWSSLWRRARVLGQVLTVWALAGGLLTCACATDDCAVLGHSQHSHPGSSHPSCEACRTVPVAPSPTVIVGSLPPVSFAPLPAAQSVQVLRLPAAQPLLRRPGSPPTDRGPPPA